MKIRKLDARGFSHDVVAIMVVVIVAVVGAGYLVATHAATVNTGVITSGLKVGSTSLCLNSSATTPAQDGPINIMPCSPPSDANTWQVKPEQVAVGGKTVQAYALSLDGGKYCAGVNAPNGRLALTVATTPKGRRTVRNPAVELFACRQSLASFTQSFQLWQSVGGTLVNINPQAIYRGSAMCMTAASGSNPVRLLPCVAASSQAITNQMWTLPSSSSSGGNGGGSGGATVKPSVPTGVKVTVKNATSVTVQWTGSTDVGGPGVGGYYIFRGSTRVGQVSAPATSYTDLNLSAGTQYSYQVEAYDTAKAPAVSALSTPPVSVTMPAASGGGSGGGGGTPTASINCKYVDDTWSGDASKVGYSVSKLSNSDGNPASFSVKLNANSSNTEVVGYPSDQCLLYSALPPNLTSSFKVTPPTTGSKLDYEYAYDIWLTTSSAAQAFNWNNDLELMIWNYVDGQEPAGFSSGAKGTLADGSKVYTAGNNTTGTVSVVLPQNETTGTVNISNIVSQLKSSSKGYITSNDDGILDVEYGIEAPYGGGQTFAVNSLSVSE